MLLKNTLLIATHPKLDANLYNDAKHLPIQSACSGGHLGIVKFLEHVNDIHSVDIDGQSCLHTAAQEARPFESCTILH